METVKMQGKGVFIRNADQADSSRIAEIYNHFVINTCVTFETELVSEEEMAQRISSLQNEGLPWLVAVFDEQVVGYAYASKWRVRPAYRFACESTVYCDPQYVGRGLGRTLYETLILQLRERHMHTVIGGIALPNPASIALHERMGFKKTAHFEQVGYKQERWVDVAYWQLML